MTTKEQFLSEHNRLSPENLKANLGMLACFREDKPALFSGDDWPVDKIRRPFIVWLTSLTRAKRAELAGVEG